MSLCDLGNFINMWRLKKQLNYSGFSTEFDVVDVYIRLRTI